MERFKWDEVTPESPEAMPGVKIYWVIDKKRDPENFAMRVFEVAGASTPYHHHGPAPMKFICCIPTKEP